MANRRQIQTDGVPQLAYQVEGKGPAFMLIHGFPENGDLWHRIVPALAEHFTVIVPDLPGVGESKLGGTDVSIEGLADAMKGILDEERIDTAVLAGHSMGGYVALAFAETYEKTVAGLAMVHSSAAADDEEKIKTRKKAIELIRKGGKEAFVKQMIPNLFSTSFKEAHPEIIDEQVKRGMMLEDLTMVAFYNAMINRPDRTAILKKAEFPIQWVLGKDDAVIPVDKALEQSSLSKVNFVSLYQHCGHMSMLENSTELNEDLTEFGNYCFRKKD